MDEVHIFSSDKLLVRASKQQLHCIETTCSRGCNCHIRPSYGDEAAAYRIEKVLFLTIVPAVRLIRALKLPKK